MKKLLLIVTVAVMTNYYGQAQISNQMQNTIQVTGEGKISVIPDQAIISIGVNSKNTQAAAAKAETDEVISKMIKTLKKNNLADSDYKTERINLFKSQDYQTKEEFFHAGQTLVITLKNLDNYEQLMSELITSGANSINGVEFKSSKILDYESKIRAKAVQNAKEKAEDFAHALNQKVGKAVQISDQSQTVYPVSRSFKAEMATGDASPTIAIGEIELNANVTIAFELF